MSELVIVYYDNWCSLCIRVKRILTVLDVNKRLTFVGIRDNDQLPFSLEAMSKEMFIKSHNSYHHGFDAFKVITKRLMVLLPIHPFLVVIGWLGLGNYFYKYVANHRKIVPVGNCEENSSCRIH